MKRYWMYVIFLLPAVVTYTVFLVYPVLSSFYYSLTDWNGISMHSTFIGMANFQKLKHDSAVWGSLTNTFQIAILLTVLQNMLGLLLALGLQGAGMIPKLLRVWYLIPLMLSPLASSYIWTYMYDPRNGVINSILKSLDLSALAQDWLGNPNLAIYSIIASTVWQTCAFSMIIYVAGLHGIPQDLYEAANIDGAGPVTKFIKLTFPLIAPAFTINMVVTMIMGFKFFEKIYIMTGGGPGGATENLATMLFKQAFTFSRMGYGSAIAIVMFAFIFIISMIQVLLLKRREVEY